MMMSKRWWMIGAGTLLCVLICSGGVGLTIYGLQSFVILGEDTDSPSIAQIEGRGRFRLPPSAKDVHARLQGFQDHILWTRFRMEPADEEVLWKSSLCAKSPDSTTINFHLSGAGRAWWNPGSPAKHSFREADTSVSQKILIDRSNPAELVVFIQTFEM